MHVLTVHTFFLRGIRYLSKNVPKRYAMIGNLLCKEEHDIVLLQEVGGNVFVRITELNINHVKMADIILVTMFFQVWSEKDYLALKQKLNCHPHSHYFKRYRTSHPNILVRYFLNLLPT